MNTKKTFRYILCSVISLIVGIAVGAGGITAVNNSHDNREYNPFEKLFPNNIKSISICAFDSEFPIRTLDERDTIYFLNRLKKLEMTGSGTEEYKQYTDERENQFKIVTTAGETYKVTVCRECAIVNGKGYKASSDAVKELSEFYESCFVTMTPFSGLTVDNVKKISICKTDSNVPSYDLTEDEKAMIIDALGTIEVESCRAQNDYSELLGLSYPNYIIETDSGTLKISVDYDVLVLNGKTYPINENGSGIKTIEDFCSSHCQ